MQPEIPKEINLREGETIQKVYNRSYISFLLSTVIPSAIFGTIILVVSIFSMIYSLLTSLQILIPAWQNLYTLIIVFLFSLIIGLIILAIVLGKYYCASHVYLITSKRIILFKKFIIITRRDVEFDKITDYLVIQGIFGRWKNYGDIQPVTAGVEFGLSQIIHSFRGITDPYAVKKEIQRITENNK
ncbi:MAG: hypothetical protein EAX96_05510 [Candidatus Lokiarchaeota archaeon]|nr:hypothetical protein [Candidatus Lokiarchaeota archaeon]